MLKKIKAFLLDLTDGSKRQDHFVDGDYRLAAAALMVHVATLDGSLSPSGRHKLHDILKARFDLDDTATDELIAAAESADRDAVDFYHFTHQLMRTLDADGRRRMIEMMWEMAYADGHVSEFEDNVIWRVADLLGISTRERIELRERVAEVKRGDGG